MRSSPRVWQRFAARYACLRMDQDQRGPILEVELLSTFNLEPILPTIQFALNCLPSRAHLRLAQLDAIEAELSQESKEPLHAQIILWRIEETLPDLLYPYTTGFPGKTCRLRRSVRRKTATSKVSLHRKNAHGVPLFLSTIPFPTNLANSVSASQHWAGLFGLVGQINQRVYEIATRESGVYVLDMAGWAACREGYSDALLDFMARQPLSAKGQLAFSLFLARCLRPLIVPARKVLALDLDNTLWGGVVGEDGVAGVKLGREFPATCICGFSGRYLSCEIVEYCWCFFPKITKRMFDRLLLRYRRCF